MLSRAAFNGLLKTLEEPPAHVKFIFATTEIRKVPVTVLSRCQRFDLRRIDKLPAVEIVYCAADSSAPLAIDALEKAGVRGIVFAATGAGSLSDRERDAVRRSVEAGRGTVFVRSTRVANGRVLSRPAFDRLGIVAADNLSPQKARILLMLALTRTTDPREIRRIFSEY